MKNEVLKLWSFDTPHLSVQPWEKQILQKCKMTTRGQLGNKEEESESPAKSEVLGDEWMWEVDGSHAKTPVSWASLRIYITPKRLHGGEIILKEAVPAEKKK